MMTMTKMNKIINWLDQYVIVNFVLMLIAMVAWIIFPLACHWIAVWTFCVLAVGSNAASYILDEVKIFLVKEDKINYNINK